MLEKLIRQDGDQLFQKILKIVRKGKCTDNIITVLDRLRDTEFDNGIIPTKLYPVNVNVDKINNIEIEKLKAQGNISKTYAAIASCDKEKEGEKFSIELTLNAQVIIIRNNFTINIFDYTIFNIGMCKIITYNLIHRHSRRIIIDKIIWCPEFFILHIIIHIFY